MVNDLLKTPKQVSARVLGEDLLARGLSGVRCLPAMW